MKTIFGLFILPVVFLSCSSKNKNSVKIDPSIRAKALDHIRKYTDTLQLTDDSIFLTTNFMAEIYKDDKLFRSTLKKNNYSPFKSTYTWRNDTLEIYIYFDWQMAGFKINIYRDNAEVNEIVNNNLAYKHELTDSIQSTIFIPSAECHLVLDKMPSKNKQDSVFGYLEYKGQNVFFIQNKIQKERNNIKLYFMSERFK